VNFFIGRGREMQQEMSGMHYMNAEDKFIIRVLAIRKPLALCKSALGVPRTRATL